MWRSTTTDEGSFHHDAVQFYGTNEKKGKIQKITRWSARIERSQAVHRSHSLQTLISAWARGWFANDFSYFFPRRTTENIYIYMNFRVININIISWFFFCFFFWCARPPQPAIRSPTPSSSRHRSLYCTNSILIFYQLVFFSPLFFSPLIRPPLFAGIFFVSILATNFVLWRGDSGTIRLALLIPCLRGLLREHTMLMPMEFFLF